MVKVLISTMETQGQRKNDFSHTLGGELLRFGTECDGERIDGRCGCRRSMTGVESGRATTTMEVVETRLTVPQIAFMISNSEIRAGLYDKDDLDAIQESFRDAHKQAKEIVRVAGAFKSGTILEKRGNAFQLRKVVNYPTILIKNPDQSNGLGETCLIEA